MHVLIGTNTLTEGSGIDRVVMIQATQLAQQGHQVRVLCFESQPGLRGPFEVISLPFAQNMSLERVRRLYPFLRPSTRHAIQLQLDWCDVMYAQQYPWSLVGVWAKHTGKRFIQVNHGVATPAHFRHWTHKLYVRWINRLALRYGRQADEVWSVSQTLADEWNRLTGQTSLVFRPQDGWMHAIPQRSPELARKELNQSVPYLLFVGRISPHKGIDILLQVMQNIWKVRPEVDLKIVGKVADQEYAEQLQREARQSSDQRIAFLGAVTDSQLGLWYQGCAAYVTAAQWEGWNLPIREALYFQRPVVCFDLPVHREFKDPLVHTVPLGAIPQFVQTCLKLI